jgi:hypothetical protein
MTDGNFDVGDDGLPRRKPGTKTKAVASDDKGKDVTESVTGPKGGSAKAKQRTTRKSSATPLVLHEAALPGGGSIALTNPREKAFFDEKRKVYAKEYPLTKPNDLSRLGQLLTLELVAHRMTQRMMGQVMLFDQNGSPTGAFEAVSDDEIVSITDRLPKVQKEIRDLEKALRIDKQAREGEGTHDIRNYFETLKRAAFDYEVHLSDRYKAYDEVVNELRWKIRILRNADQEDKDYHQISEASIIKYIEDELLRLEELDIKFAADKQALWVGKL